MYWCSSDRCSHQYNISLLGRPDVCAICKWPTYWLSTCSISFKAKVQLLLEAYILWKEDCGEQGGWHGTLYNIKSSSVYIIRKIHGPFCEFSNYRVLFIIVENIKVYFVRYKIMQINKTSVESEASFDSFILKVKGEKRGSRSAHLPWLRDSIHKLLLFV